METITHRYQWYSRVFCFTFNCLGFIFPVFIIGAMLATGKATELPPVIWLALLGVALCAAFTFILAANFFPEITTDQEGMNVSFLWQQLRVPWADVIKIQPSWYNPPRHTAIWVVHTRALTPFHRVYGLLYSFSFHPSFIIHQDIGECDKLIRKIQSYQKRASKRNSN